MSKRDYADISNAYERARDVLDLLFPTYSLEHLKDLSLIELLALLPSASNDSTSAPSTMGLHPTEQTMSYVRTTTCDSPTTSILDLEPSPSQDFGWDESANEGHDRQLCEDDVNGLSTLFDTTRNHSYLGISSMPTIMRVMVHTSLPLRQTIQNLHGVKSRPSTRPYSGYHDGAGVSCADTVAVVEESSLIDAYFRSIHGITPMVDEIGFRRCRAQGGDIGQARRPWLALLNMILTLGYIAMNDDSQSGHTVFFDRAAKHLDMSCFASGHIYTLQALALFGGYYLHFLNKPNMASAVMGAAHRMAVAMGLHQVPSTKIERPETSHDVDTRTRTWWSLFCLDIWAGPTLGRPIASAWSVQHMHMPTTSLHDNLV